MKSNNAEWPVVSHVGGIPATTHDTHAKTPLRLIYIGSVQRGKGLYEILRGLEYASVSGIKVRLVIAGRGQEYASLKRFSENLGLGKVVSFVGPVFGADKAALLQSSDVMFLPADAEGLPYAMLDGMAAGIPFIVMQRNRAIRDLIIDGVHGLFVDADDPYDICWAITRMATDRELLVRMDAEVRTHMATRYFINRVKELSESLCARHKIPKLKERNMYSMQVEGGRRSDRGGIAAATVRLA
ncbi:MAG: glycosyltransferase family 4 protein [Betaproteobacteria bacterium]|nr:glycosyltransferase family 4 protein [Betaproteobacteria bacterium]